MTPSWKEGHLEVIEKMVDLVGIDPIQVIDNT
jgi:hypothetical protein